MQVREQTSVRNEAATENRRMLHRVAETQIHKRSRFVGSAAHINHSAKKSRHMPLAAQTVKGNIGQDGIGCIGFLKNALASTGDAGVNKLSSQSATRIHQISCTHFNPTLKSIMSLLKFSRFTMLPVFKFSMRVFLSSGMMFFLLAARAF